MTPPLSTVRQTWAPPVDLSAATLTTEPTLQLLLEAVYAHPDDHTPRLVLADYFIERGDSLGSYLRRSVAGETDDDLLTEFPPVPWLPLGDRDVDFVRGFPSMLHVRREALAGLSPVAWWRTVSGLRFDEGLGHASGEVQAAATAYFIESWPGAPLRAVDGLSLEEVRHVGDGASAWTSLGLCGHTPLQSGAFALVPNLERLRLYDVSAPLGRDALLSLKRLQSLEVSSQGPLATVRLPPSVRRLILRVGAVGAADRLVEDAPGLTHLDVEGPGFETGDLERLTLLESLSFSSAPAPIIPALPRLTALGLPATVDVRTQLQSAMRRNPLLTSVAVVAPMDPWSCDDVPGMRASVVDAARAVAGTAIQCFEIRGGDEFSFEREPGGEWALNDDGVFPADRKWLGEVLAALEGRAGRRR